MNELDAFVVAFGLGFYFSSQRFRHHLGLLGLRRTSGRAASARRPRLE